MLTLIAYKVENFRSVYDSGWIDVQDVTSFVGTNEAGKTNLLLPLWKLNPAKDGKIDPLADMPRDRYTSMRNVPAKYTFIRARFTISTSMRESLFELMDGEENSHKPAFDVVEVSRNYEGKYEVFFPHDLHVDVTSALCDQIVKAMPTFVYYSNYGNLDSEIHLPTVIATLQTPTTSAKAIARARTIRVLFQMVDLSPAEIHDLGRAIQNAHNNGEGGIENAQKKVRERQVLLDSAGAKLTRDFKEWWKQGNYRFKLAADGDYFRIWVSDSKRTEEIELENRSTGLQWFLSFYLVFSAESESFHKNTVLLLDEPGLTLHPLAQEDLFGFFNSLAAKNQVLYTTHSPFLVDHDHLDRVRVVFQGPDGSTQQSSDLKAGLPREEKAKSVFAVNAALGLSISKSVMQGCQGVVVEGPSDQLYLSAMKTVLIAKELFAPKAELLFAPAGGASGIKAVAPLVAIREDDLPFVLLDDDENGRHQRLALERSQPYSQQPAKLIDIQKITGIAGAEVEDLLPAEIVDVANREYQTPDEDFKDAFVVGKPIVPQIEGFANQHRLQLKPGWKVELARKVKERIARNHDRVSSDTLAVWQRLFATFSG